MTARNQAASGITASPSEARRLAAVCLDAFIALVGGVVAGAAVAVGTAAGSGVTELQPASPGFWGPVAGAIIALSFANQVLLTLATRASLGKLVTGLRVVRSSDGGRAGFVRLVGRWLFGFYWLIVFVPLHLATDSNVEQQDAVGMRIVRRAVRS
ncbi:RDD family protein [Streptomyces sp. NPDC000931]|uniref:RDD family protein n=1 Tax=Streptomyces sp. NPDC000931 TaxID=3154372 RepID=UPI00333199C9